MAKDIKKIIAQEYIKCAKDPAYFMKKYCHIQHPTRGRILFNLYPFQSEVLHLFKEHQYIITLKSRQLGISTLASAYSLWLMLFHKDKNVLALATTQATARNLVTKTMFMYDELPKWLKLPALEKNKLSLRLRNGSKITAKSSNADAARSEAVSLLLIDEAAFIDNIAETFTAAQRGTITTLTDGATVTPDFAASNNYTLTLGGNRTIANPTNLTAGQSGSIFLVQDGTGSRTASWGSYWDFAGGTAPTLTTTASAVDRIDYVVRSSTSIHAVATLAYS